MAGAPNPRQVLAELGVSRETLERLEIYARLLAKWNKAINLVGADSVPDLWRRHMLDSAQLLALLPSPPDKRQRRLADLGSGAGFPGLVLAILGAGEIHLVESDGRKAQFLREVSRETAAGALVHQARIEDLSPLCADCVTARALAPLDRLLEHAARHLAPGGIALFPKGKGAAAELTRAAARWSMVVTRHPSRSDPGGTILRIGELTARPGP
jgi:16S rRNA (guanine527-N7)-methyltransferase